MPPHPDDVASAAKLLAGAERVVVLAGLGAVEAGAGAACRALAAKTGGLLSTTLPARGLFHDDPFCIGISGSFTPEVGLEYLKEADLVVAVGCSLAYHAGGGGQLWPKAKMLQIDIDPVAVSQGQEVARHHLRADARLGVEALTAALPAREHEAGAAMRWRRASAIRSPTARCSRSSPDCSTRATWSRRWKRPCRSDWEMVNSGGHCSWFFAQMPSRPQEKFLTIREFGAIGNGISFAMGVAAARPDRTVVLFDGDGSLMMHVQELETIKRHRLNILIVVMNDGAYGSEVHKLRSEGMPEDGSVFGYCDFAGIARGFGLAGKTFKNLDDLPKLRGGVRRKRRRRGLGLSRLGQGRVSDHPPRPSPSCEDQKRLRRMKAPELIDKRIAELGDWRGETLKRMRKLIKEADPEVVEEWKWMGTPVWSHGGIICTGESYKAIVKLTFAKGASLKDPAKLFNSSLDGNVRRAIDIHEGEEVDAGAFKALIRAAVALNTSGAKTKPKTKPKRAK